MQRMQQSMAHLIGLYQSPLSWKSCNKERRPGHHEIRPRVEMPVERFEELLKQGVLELISEEGQSGGFDLQSAAACVSRWVHGRDEWEMERKGFANAFLECEDGCHYQVMFIDPVRLAQDIKATLQSGQSYYYEFGQIIVPEVTIAAISKIVPLLVAEGYLDRHRPMREVVPGPLVDLTAPGQRQ